MKPRKNIYLYILFVVKVDSFHEGKKVGVPEQCSLKINRGLTVELLTQTGVLVEAPE